MHTINAKDELKCLNYYHPIYVHVKDYQKIPGQERCEKVDEVIGGFKWQGNKEIEGPREQQ